MQGLRTKAQDVMELSWELKIPPCCACVYSGSVRASRLSLGVQARNLTLSHSSICRGKTWSLRAKRSITLSRDDRGNIALIRLSLRGRGAAAIQRLSSHLVEGSAPFISKRRSSILGMYAVCLRNLTLFCRPRCSMPHYRPRVVENQQNKNSLSGN